MILDNCKPKMNIMNYDKNDKVTVQTKTGEMNGAIKDRFIQNTKLEMDGKTLNAKATSESPAYLVQFENGKSALVSESALSMLKEHTA